MQRVTYEQITHSRVPSLLIWVGESGNLVPAIQFVSIATPLIQCLDRFTAYYARPRFEHPNVMYHCPDLTNLVDTDRTGWKVTFMIISGMKGGDGACAVSFW